MSAADATLAETRFVPNEGENTRVPKLRRLLEHLIAAEEVTLDDAVAAIASLTPAADRYIYFTSATAAALGTITAFGRSLVDDADAATARTTLGLATVASSGSATDLTTGTLPAGRMPALTGDVTTVAGAVATTLATVNSNVGSFGSATQVATFTVNAKGLTTAASNVTITPAVGSITGFGTGVATALGVNIGSSGAFVTFNGALGTPSSGTLTNATGLPIAGLVASTTTALGVGTVELGHATDTTLARSSAGNVTIEGNLIYRAGGTDVPVADGGTGASDASGARTNLGLVIGTNVQAYDADLDAVASSGLAGAWTPFTPTVAAGVGAFTTVSASGRYKQVDKIVFVRILVTITTNGTASSYFTVTAPVTGVNALDYTPLFARELASAVGVAGNAVLQPGTATIYVQKYDGTYLGGDGFRIAINGSYEAA